MSSGGVPVRDASPPPRPQPRVGHGRANGWCVMDGWRKPRRLPRGGLSFPEGRVCGSSAVAVGAPGPARREEKASRLRALGGLSARRPGRRGAALCVSVAVGSPRLFTRRVRSGPGALPRSLLSLVRCARGAFFPRVLRPQPLLNFCVPRPLPGVTADAPHSPTRVVVYAGRAPRTVLLPCGCRPSAPAPRLRWGCWGWWRPWAGSAFGARAVSSPGVCCVCLGPRAPGRRKRGGL